MKRRLKSILNNILNRDIASFDDIKLMIGKSLCFAQKKVKPQNLSAGEVTVFSQWGAAGIIEFLISNIPISNKFFVEFGVENYRESNTRFLMINRNWSGLVIDGSRENIEDIKRQKIYWQYDLHALNHFITKDNINEIIRNELLKLKIDNNIGILSIDIDGVDYWVLKEISVINPSIVICEYNSLYGNQKPFTVPYDPEFSRSRYSHTNLYWGANLKAFETLLKDKGYSYIGSNIQNLNAFFVKSDIATKYIPDLIVNSDDTFEYSKIRETRNSEGKLNYLRREQLNEISNLKLVDLEKNSNILIEELISIT